MTSPWLDNKPAPDVRVLTLDELLEVWRKHRSGVKGANTVLGACAADEVCRRVAATSAGDSAVMGDR